MMVHAGLPDKFWAEDVECAPYIRNRTPTSAIKGNKIPVEVWSGKKPDVLHMKYLGVWGMHMSQMHKGRSLTRRQ